jgi:hypothetical protein
VLAHAIGDLLPSAVAVALSRAGLSAINHGNLALSAAAHHGFSDHGPQHAN